MIVVEVEYDQEDLMREAEVFVEELRRFREIKFSTVPEKSRPVVNCGQMIAIKALARIFSERQREQDTFRERRMERLVDEFIRRMDQEERKEALS